MSFNLALNPQNVTSQLNEHGAYGNVANPGAANISGVIANSQSTERVNVRSGGSTAVAGDSNISAQGIPSVVVAAPHSELVCFPASTTPASRSSHEKQSRQQHQRKRTRLTIGTNMPVVVAAPIIPTATSEPPVQSGRSKTRSRVQGGLSPQRHSGSSGTTATTITTTATSTAGTDGTIGRRKPRGARRDSPNVSSRSTNRRTRNPHGSSNSSTSIAVGTDATTAAANGNDRSARISNAATSTASSGGTGRGRMSGRRISTTAATTATGNTSTDDQLVSGVAPRAANSATIGPTNRMYAWERNFILLRKWVAKYGHARVSRDLDTKQFPRLGAWVHRQRAVSRVDMCERLYCVLCLRK